ncbi:hypothetical protein [Flavobacterium sp. UBA4197]|uniref:hypothetical protein n=1 Tax=Flavobacterium sp. UBA4197 TaxID=1946546 RepID=UPI00257E1E41|nr:hypothetical protein [Flavobacterium sp. UBA4197]
MSNQTQSDTVISISETHYTDYTNRNSREKSIAPRVTITKDTTVNKSDVQKVRKKEREQDD